jgi:RAD50-interacting protein 1
MFAILRAERRSSSSLCCSSNTQTGQDGDRADDVSLAPTLLGPIALLSSHLIFLKSVLPHPTALALYRSIASRLAGHILQRQIQYRGRIRISPAEGASIRAECELWVETSRGSLVGMPGLTGSRTEGPWRRLLEAGRLCGLEGEDWRKVVLTTFGAHDDEKWEEVVVSVIGFSELSREEVSQVLRTRSDCEL